MVDAPAAPPPPSKPRGSFFRELPFLVIVAFALALLIKAFLVQAFFIPSGSMEHTLEVNDRVLVNKLVYDFRDIRRGEIVVFDGEGNFGDNEEQTVVDHTGVRGAIDKVTSLVGLGPNGKKDYIKRVIGIPGDRVACCDAKGRVMIQTGNGAPVSLDEPYIYTDESGRRNVTSRFCEAGMTDVACPDGAPGVLVKPGTLWVMGDHRERSADSRSHLDEPFHGLVPQDHVVGRAFVRVWPLDRLGTLPVPATFNAAGPLALGVVGAVPLTLLRRRRRERGRHRLKA